MRGFGTPVAEAAEFLVSRGFYGVVWLGPTLVVEEVEGPLVAGVPTGLPVGEAVLQLNGFDEQILALREVGRGSFELANVAIIGPGGTGRRLNFYVHWDDRRGRFLVLVARTTNQETMDAELERLRRRAALAEKKIVEQAAELERSNRELTEYAYIISHDLRAPMRALRYRLEDLQRAICEGRSAAAAELSAGLDQQSRRMSRMLGDLLVYARIGRAEAAAETVDTGALVAAVVASLPRPEGMQIDVAGEWACVELASAALDLVLRNLLDNAIKHHDAPAQGRIVIAARRVAAGLEITLADDGPGIAREHHELVFQPFRRLVPAAGNQPDGSGIGLSLVRKTAEANGAVLELVSDPPVQRGTLFRLTWPCRIVVK